MKITVTENNPSSEQRTSNYHFGDSDTKTAHQQKIVEKKLIKRIYDTGLSKSHAQCQT